MTDKQKQIYLNLLSDGFDTYVADGRMDMDVPGDDLLGQYVRDIVDRNPHLGGADPETRDSFKEGLQSFLGDMMDKFNHIDRSAEPENLLRTRFSQGSPGQRRALWSRVKELAKSGYSPTELNTDGYDSQLRPDNEQQIYDMFLEDWQQAARKRIRKTKTNLLASSSAQWERDSRSSTRQDYHARLVVRETLRRYPVLDEIARIMGRCHDQADDDPTRLSRCDSPSTLSATPSSEEIDRITLGNDIERVLPSEISYLAGSDTEMIFMARYADRQLQQFSTPGGELSVRQRDMPRPRPIRGPIIVSVDTSGSMEGYASEIAFAMLHRLVEIARRQHRPCYLITYSVRCKAMDLSQACGWSRIREFLRDSYTGGTNGERMLREAINQLHTDRYSMADVLIITDFAFAPPVPNTLGLIRMEQSCDTRFYGLQIGKINTPYTQILNRIWVVE